MRVVQDLTEADLVIADLTYLNANVFYELAVRHSTAKPFIHVCRRGTKIPFDVATISTIEIDAELRDNSFSISLTKGRDIENQLKEQIGFIKSGASLQCPVSGLLSNRTRQYARILYHWDTLYEMNLAEAWLAQQSDKLKGVVNQFMQGQQSMLADKHDTPETDDTPMVPDDAQLRNGLAEFLALRAAEGSKYNGDLFCVVDNNTGALECGWAVYQFPGSPPVAIQIGGRQVDESHIEIDFDQPERKVSIVNFNAVISPYRYTVRFKRQPNRHLEGKIYHPTTRNVVVGHATLMPRFDY
jgi:hypothetical protein